MNALLDHIWGDSPAADRVWEHVTGLAPRKAVSRRLVALQAFIDDSWSPDGAFVLAGYMATAETWAKFAKEWEEALPYGLRDERGYYFHMAEMAETPERMERVGYFYSIILSHHLRPFAIRINISDLRAAINRIWILGRRIDFGIFKHPHIVAFCFILRGLHENRVLIKDRISMDERIDFIFDRNIMEKGMLKEWLNYSSQIPEDLQLNVSSAPRFESDRDFLPLQAADLIAWWVRKWFENGQFTKDVFEPLFDFPMPKNTLEIMVGDFDEDAIVNMLKLYLKDPLGGECVVYDSKYSGMQF